MFFIILCVVLGILLLWAIYYLIKFARVIMILEDDFSETIDALGSIQEQLDKMLGMQLFFDSKEVKIVVQEALNEIKNSRTVVNKLIQKFVDRSKKKYVVIVENEPTEELKEKLLREKFMREGIGNGF